jgi:hypothetical protein
VSINPGWAQLTVMPCWPSSDDDTEQQDRADERNCGTAHPQLNIKDDDFDVDPRVDASWLGSDPIADGHEQILVCSNPFPRKLSTQDNQTLRFDPRCIRRAHAFSVGFKYPSSRVLICFWSALFPKVGFK